MGDKEFPLVSIAVPAYNHEKYIECFLKSVLAQDYPNIEIVIGDDCSTDRTYEILQSFQEQLKSKCSRVVIYQNEHNYGLVKSLNKILACCKGDYIKTMASDDFLIPTSISEYMDFVRKNPLVEVVVADGYIVGSSVTSTEQLRDNNVTIAKAVDESKIDNDWIKYIYENNIFGVGICYKSNIYLKTGMYNESLFYDDWDMNLRVAISGAKYGILHKPLVVYRIHDSSISHEMSDDKRLKLFEGALEIYDKYMPYVGEKVRNKVVLERSYRFLREGYVYGMEKVIKRTSEELKRMQRPLFLWKCCHARTVFTYYLRKCHRKIFTLKNHRV